jgi:hypothetical protein
MPEITITDTHGEEIHKPQPTVRRCSGPIPFCLVDTRQVKR